MIKAVIFDCFGVLTTDLWKEYCSTLPPEIMPKIHELNHARGDGRLTRDEFVDKLAMLVGQSRDTVDLASRPGGTKNAQLINYIRELRSRKYKTGILSNIGSNWIRDSLLTETEQELFDEMIFSFEVGMTKPDSNIFYLTCKRLNVEPQSAIMVDDIETYCQAAKSIGMQTVCYHDFKQFEQELTALLA